MCWLALNAPPCRSTTSTMLRRFPHLLHTPHGSLERTRQSVALEASRAMGFVPPRGWRVARAPRRVSRKQAGGSRKRRQNGGEDSCACACLFAVCVCRRCRGSRARTDWSSPRRRVPRGGRPSAWGMMAGDRPDAADATWYFKMANAYSSQGRYEREFFIDNLLVRVHFIIVMIRWTGLAPWEFEFPFPGSLTSTFLGQVRGGAGALQEERRYQAQGSSTPDPNPPNPNPKP